MTDRCSATDPDDDRRQIIDVLHRYCRSMDRLDRALGYTIWDGHGVVDYGEIFQGTGRDFIDFACGYHSTLAATSHHVDNITINLMREQAGSESYVTVALLSKTDKSYVLQTGRGRYLDEWTRRDGKWAIARRQFLLNFAVSQAVDQPWIGIDSRNRLDPSYARLGDAAGLDPA